MSSSTAAPLYRIDECADLMADACVGDEPGNLVFLSVWARDTAIQEFIARLTLKNDPRALDQIHLVSQAGSSVPVFIPNVDGLEKRLTRAHRRTLFGALTHLWLFDRRCVRPDKVNASALSLIKRDDENLREQLWRLVQNTCPLPLLPHWRDTVLDLLQSNQMLIALPCPIGPLQGYRLAIDVPALTHTLGQRIVDGSLDTADTACPAHIGDAPDMPDTSIWADEDETLLCAA